MLKLIFHPLTPLKMCFLSLMSEEGDGILCALHTRWCEIFFLLVKRWRWRCWRIPANVRPGWPFRSRRRRPSSSSQPTISFLLSQMAPSWSKKSFWKHQLNSGPFSLVSCLLWLLKLADVSGRIQRLEGVLGQAWSFTRQWVFTAFLFYLPPRKTFPPSVHSLIHCLFSFCRRPWTTAPRVSCLGPPPWPPAPHCIVSTGAATHCHISSNFIWKKQWVLYKRHKWSRL